MEENKIICSTVEMKSQMMTTQWSMDKLSVLIA